MCGLNNKVMCPQVDENMKVAQKRNAVQEGMFYFRKDIFKGEWRRRFGPRWAPAAPRDKPAFLLPPGCNPVLDAAASAQNGVESDGANEEYTLMSIDNIINGKVGALRCSQPVSTTAAQPGSVVAPVADCRLLPGGGVPRPYSHPQLLPGKHGSGRGHPLHHPELPEAHQKARLR